MITPTKLGTWPVICTELCGLGHSLMRSQAIVMTEGRLRRRGARTRARRRPAAAGRRRVRPRPIFTSNGCGACHTFSADPGGAGQDRARPRQPQARPRETAGKPLEDFIRESIVDPNAYIAPGFNPPSAMPPFKDTIPPAELDALVQYLAANTK